MTASSSDSKIVENVPRMKSNGKRVLEYFQNNFFFLAQGETHDLSRHNYNFNVVEYQRCLCSVTEDEGLHLYSHSSSLPVITSTEPYYYFYLFVSLS